MDHSATTAGRPNEGTPAAQADDAQSLATSEEPQASDAGSVVAEADASDVSDGADDADDSDDNRPDTSGEQGSAKTIVDWAIVVFSALLIAIVVRTFVVAHFRVEGNSMLETLHPGDRIFVNKLSYRFGEPGRGDVVVLHELHGQRDLIKRVIALPGETIKIEDCLVYIDDRVLPETYLSDAVLADTSWCEFDPVKVPDGSVFVMGDNRPASADSRYFGPIPESGIVGKAFVIFWPLSDAGGL